MAICSGHAPARHGGRSMHDLVKPQRCGALPVFDGYCPIHLKARGYTRCPECSAWRQPAGHRGLSLPICDVCSSMGGPRQPLDARAHYGDGDGALRELDTRDRRARANLSPACPVCHLTVNVHLVADSMHAEAPRDVWKCFACVHSFTAD